MKILVDDFGFKTHEFVKVGGRIVHRSVSMGDEKIAVRFDTSCTENKKNGTKTYETTMVVISRIHTIDTFPVFVDRFTKEGHDVITGPFICVVCDDTYDGYTLDKPDKIYNTDILEGCRKAVTSNNRGNILLHGPPGTGKTNIIKALAHEFNACIYPVKMSDFTSINSMRCSFSRKSTYASYQEINNYVKIRTEKRFFLFEDFDTMMPEWFWKGESSSTDDDKEGEDMDISYSDLLNLLDGVVRIPNVYTFWTTNHIDRINPSFSRPGRMHYCGLVSKMTREDCTEFIKDHYPECNETLTRDCVTIAEMYATKMHAMSGDDFVRMLNKNYIDTVSFGGGETTG
jgi:hypothetical protein